MSLSKLVIIPIPGMGPDKDISYHIDEDKEILSSNLKRRSELRSELGRKNYVGVSYSHGPGPNNKIRISNVLGDNNPFVSHDTVYQGYKDLPKKLRDPVQSIFIENQPIQRGNKYITGFTVEGRDWMVLLPPSGRNPALYVKQVTIPHESAHILDKSYKYSNSRDYIDNIRLDNLFNNGKWHSDYAEYTYNKRIRESRYGPYSDDFAESIRLYLIPETNEGLEFRRLFPHRTEFIKKLLGV